MQHISGAEVRAVSGQTNSTLQGLTFRSCTALVVRQNLHATSIICGQDTFK